LGPEEEQQREGTTTPEDFQSLSGTKRKTFFSPLLPQLVFVTSASEVVFVRRLHPYTSIRERDI